MYIKLHSKSYDPMPMNKTYILHNIYEKGSNRKRKTVAGIKKNRDERLFFANGDVLFLPEDPIINIAATHEYFIFCTFDVHLIIFFVNCYFSFTT